MFFIAGGCRDVELFELEWVTQKHFHYLTSKNTNHSRASVEGREMYSILYLDESHSQMLGKFEYTLPAKF